MCKRMFKDTKKNTKYVTKTLNETHRKKNIFDGIKFLIQNFLEALLISKVSYQKLFFSIFRQPSHRDILFFCWLDKNVLSEFQI